MRNTYILFILQALLTLLLFFSEGAFTYVTIAVVLIIDLMLFLNILTKSWRYEEFMSFAAIFCSVIFLAMYNYSMTYITNVFGIVLMLLFLVVAMLDYMDVPIQKSDNAEKIQRPRPPESYDAYEGEPAYYYDIEDVPAPVKKTARPVVKAKTQEHKVTKDNTVTKALAYELEREAQQLKGVQEAMNKLEVYHVENELSKEAKELMNVQKQIDDIHKKKAQSQVKDLKKQVKSLQNAEKDIKQIKFLDQQENIVKQAKDIVKAQKQIDSLSSKVKKSSKTVKTVKSKNENYYFATKNGNKFHDPGCLRIKNVSKSKLTLFTKKKDAMKKGLQPCIVCIPK